MVTWPWMNQHKRKYRRDDNMKQPLCQWSIPLRHCLAPQCWQKAPPGDLPQLAQKSGQALPVGLEGTEAVLDGALGGA